MIICFYDTVAYFKKSGGRIKKDGEVFQILRRLFLFNFEFFLHVNLFPVWVIEYIFQERKFLAWNNLDTKSVFHLPLPFQGNKSLINIGSDIRVDV